MQGELASNNFGTIGFGQSMADEKQDDKTQSDVKLVYNPITTEELAYQTHQYASHVYHSVSWSKYMNQHFKQKHLSKIQLRILERNKDAFTLSNVFSVQECQKMIYLSECHGYVQLLSASKGKTFRTNTRVIIEDKSLAQLLYHRIKMFLPTTYKMYGKVWEIDGLNGRFRFCKWTTV